MQYQNFRSLVDGEQVQVPTQLIQKISVSEGKEARIYQDGDSYFWLLTSPNFSYNLLFDYNKSYELESCVDAIRNGKVADNPLVMHIAKQFEFEREKHLKELSVFEINPKSSESDYYILSFNGILANPEPYAVLAPVYYKHFKRTNEGFMLLLEDEKTIVFVDSKTFGITHVLDMSNTQETLIKIETMGGATKNLLLAMDELYDIQIIRNFDFKAVVEKPNLNDGLTHFTHANHSQIDPESSVTIEGYTFKFSGKVIYEMLNFFIFFNQREKLYFLVTKSNSNKMFSVKSAKRLTVFLFHDKHSNTMYLNRHNPQHAYQAIESAVKTVSTLDPKICVFSKETLKAIEELGMYKASNFAFDGEILKVSKLDAKEKYAPIYSFVLLKLNPNSEFTEKYGVAIINYTGCKFSRYNSVKDDHHEIPQITYLYAENFFLLIEQLEEYKLKNYCNEHVSATIDDVIDYIGITAFPELINEPYVA